MVWYLNWVTESGDRGQWGYWRNPPTSGDQLAYMKQHHPDEFPADKCGPGPDGGYIYWKLERFDCIDP